MSSSSPMASRFSPEATPHEGHRPDMGDMAGDGRALRVNKQRSDGTESVLRNVLDGRGLSVGSAGAVFLRRGSHGKQCEEDIGGLKASAAVRPAGKAKAALSSRG